jgi:hypothetical protein
VAESSGSYFNYGYAPGRHHASSASSSPSINPRAGSVYSSQSEELEELELDTRGMRVSPSVDSDTETDATGSDDEVDDSVDLPCATSRTSHAPSSSAGPTSVTRHEAFPVLHEQLAGAPTSEDPPQHKQRYLHCGLFTI